MGKTRVLVTSIHESAKAFEIRLKEETDRFQCPIVEIIKGSANADYAVITEANVLAQKIMAERKYNV